ncbi:hypothetical protein GCM10022207_64310 [Streptomyces lannensis]|uniref:Uncharacterized protein n=1 Tax=Streptomyces lannensis TaxID=766498 RepID=A0ABP7KX35_9ACTN
MIGVQENEQQDGQPYRQGLGGDLAPALAVLFDSRRMVPQPKSRQARQTAGGRARMAEKATTEPSRFCLWMSKQQVRRRADGRGEQRPADGLADSADTCNEGDSQHQQPGSGPQSSAKSALFPLLWRTANPSYSHRDLLVTSAVRNYHRFRLVDSHRLGE